jgi:hypothetical protein
MRYPNPKPNPNPITLMTLLGTECDTTGAHIQSVPVTIHSHQRQRYNVSMRKGRSLCGDHGRTGTYLHLATNAPATTPLATAACAANPAAHV